MKQVQKHEHREEEDLRGTAIFVAILGVFIALGLLGTLFLFTSRGLTFLAM